MPTDINWVVNPDGSQGETWNVVTGCTPASEGCTNCYAKRIHDGNIRRGFTKTPFSEIVLHPERLDRPRTWKKKSRMIFVCSMSDLFHPQVPFEFIEKVWDVMFDCSFSYRNIANTPYHTFVILTKRPERMAEFYKWMNRGNRNANFGNIWLMVTAETQKQADIRIPILLSLPAAKHGVSVEPMLEEISFAGLTGNIYRPWLDYHAWKPALDWIVCGAESGSIRRPVSVDAIRNLKNQSVAAGVLFFLKQMEVNGELVKMPELDGMVWNQVPERLAK